MHKELRPEQVDILVGSSPVNTEFSNKVRELDRRLRSNGMSYRDWESLNDRQHDIFTDNLFLDGQCATSVDDYVKGAVNSCGCPDTEEDLHHHSPVLMREIEKQQEMLPDMKVKIGEGLDNLNEIIDLLLESLVIGEEDEDASPEVDIDKAAVAAAFDGLGNPGDAWAENINKIKSDPDASPSAFISEGGAINELWFGVEASGKVPSESTQEAEIVATQKFRAKKQVEELQKYIKTLPQYQGLALSAAEIWWTGPNPSWGAELMGYNVNSNLNPSDILFKWVAEGKALGVSLKSYTSGTPALSNPGMNIFSLPPAKGGLGSQYSGGGRIDEVSEEVATDIFTELFNNSSDTLRQKGVDALRGQWMMLIQSGYPYDKVMEKLEDDIGRKILEGDLYQAIGALFGFSWLLEKSSQSGEQNEDLESLKNILAEEWAGPASAQGLSKGRLNAVYTRLKNSVVEAMTGLSKNEMISLGKKELMNQYGLSSREADVATRTTYGSSGWGKAKGKKVVPFAAKDLPEGFLTSVQQNISLKGKDLLKEFGTQARELFNNLAPQQQDEFLSFQLKLTAEPPYWVAAVGMGKGAQIDDPLGKAPAWKKVSASWDGDGEYPVSFEAEEKDSLTMTIYVKYNSTREKVGTMRPKWASNPLGNLKWSFSGAK